MTKELEAKDLQANFITCFKELLTKTDKDIIVVNISRAMAQDMVNLYEKYLTINPSEALQGVDILYANAIDLTTENTKYLPEYLKPIRDTIKQALQKSQEDKIIADFIRKHYELSNDINKNYLELKKPITMEEHNKFKEVFKLCQKD